MDRCTFTGRLSLDGEGTWYFLFVGLPAVASALALFQTSANRRATLFGLGVAPSLLAALYLWSRVGSPGYGNFTFLAPAFYLAACALLGFAAIRSAQPSRPPSLAHIALGAAIGFGFAVGSFVGLVVSVMNRIG